ncbi:MAG: hypothetical protein M9921_04000 [Fimbriimonadaceae bacterium]|nr:hypothetical protein [Chthonomonadaceae bacterium]MCO5295998.1 hypothetical protein [Fimbriimonadaceae bacterium]
MILMLALLAGQPQTPEEAFKHCLAAHKAMRSASIAVESKLDYAGLSPGGGRFDLAFSRPDRALLRVQEPKREGRPATDRRYLLTPGRLTGFDMVANEFLKRDAPPKGTLAERFVLLLGGLDDAVQAVLEPSVLAAFLARYEQVTNWQMVRKPGLLRLQHATGASSARFDLDASQFTLRAVHLEIPNGTLDWTFRYSAAPPRIDFAPAGSWIEVPAFYVGAAATYADAQAKALANKSIRAYENYRRGAFTVGGSDGSVSAAVDGREGLQRGADYQWVFDGRAATLELPGGAYSGKCSLMELLSALSAANRPIDPFLRLLLARRNPMRELLGPGMKARVVGSIVREGVPCDILEIASPGVRISAWIRKDNGLIAVLSTENRDAKGKLVSESEKVFAYTPLPTGETFSVAAQGAKPLGELLSRN